MLHFEKALIVKPSSLGDIIHSLPFLSAFKKSYPGTAVHWVIAKGLEDLLEGHPLIEKLWIIDKDKWKRWPHLFSTLNDLRLLFASLRRERYDLAVDLQGLFRSGLIARSTRSSFIVGFQEAREGSRFLYTHRVSGGRDIHAVDRYLKIADFLGCDTKDVEFPLHLPDDLAVTHRRHLEHGRYAVLIPGARWATKRWPPERFGEIAAKLPIPSVLIGSSSDVPLAQRAVDHSSGRAISLAGKTSLKEVARIISKAGFVLTNDTGTMHLAAALGVKVFALFGPTDPKRTGPYGEGHVIITAGASCSPCFRKRCATPYCMDNISVDRTYSVIQANIPLDTEEEK